MTETMVSTALESAAAVTEETDFADAVTDEFSHAADIFSNIAEPVKAAVPTFIFAAVCAVVGFILIKIVMHLVTKGIKRSSMDGIAGGFLRSIIKILLYVLLAVVLLSLLHVPMDSIVAVLISSSMAVALALKDSLSNVAGGFILSFAKPAKEGDIIEIDGSKGRVESVGMLYTKIVTYGNVTVYVPNGKVSSSKIINYTEKDTRRVELKFNISYDDSISHARETILKAAMETGLVLTEPAAKVNVNGHADSSIELLLLAWVKTEDYWTAYYAINEVVKTALDSEGITIPYPHLDILTREEKMQIKAK